MRRISLTLLFAIVLPLATLAAGDLPFEAYVVPAEAEVYSSPAEPRYATNAIPRGTKVEVYERRDEWLGIRPPEGSYSWVLSESMTMNGEPAVAEAAADGVASWIGSSAERVKEHQSSVQLKKGERVEILGKKEVESADGQREVWLKIAPPAGEFRWVHASQVSRDAPAAFTVVPPETATEEWATRANPRRLSATETRSTFAAAQQVSHTAQDREDGQSRAATGPFRRNSMELRDLAPPPRRAGFQRDDPADLVQQVAHQAEGGEPPTAGQPLSPDGFVPRQPRSVRPLPLTAGRTAPMRHSAASGRVARDTTLHKQSPPVAGNLPITPVAPADDAAGNSSTGISAAQMQRRLEEIDVALALMVSRDRSQWNLAALKREVQQLVENGATPVDRGEARFMLEKIERFAETFGVDDYDESLDLPVGSVAARKAALEAATAPQYDGSGYLTPVRAARPVAPYALLDQSGNRICYVTPVPGFNLRPYENRKIGLFGKRGYMPDVSAPHLLAERVVDLDKQSR